MKPNHIDTILENQTLKSEFTMRNLDLSQVWQETPDNPELENRQLRHLLDWVDKYLACPDRKKLEAQGYEFPPISYCIDPDSDWYRFKRWIRGLPTRKTLIDQLPPDFKIRRSEDIQDTEIETALDELIEQFEKINYGVAIINAVPPRLLYEHLLELLEEEHEMLGMSGWQFDGCTGTCPDCFQRPWCEYGCNSCWKEDEELGKIYFSEPVRGFVSASPQSLAILSARQAEEDRRFAEFQANNDGEIKLAPPPPFDDSDDDGIPF
ncbi:MAG: hypothetical protein ACT6FF_08265 [Methanosarcinaceae archaeon]